MPASLAHLVRALPSVHTDQALLRAHAATSDPAAFPELVRRYAGLARRAAAEVYRPAADDVAQSTLALLARTAAAATTPSAKVRQRLLVALASVPWPWPKRTGEELRQVRAVGVLAALGPPPARRLLRERAAGDPHAPLTREARAALGRLGG